MNNWQEFTDAIGNNRVIENDQAKLYIEVERIDDLINIVKEATIHKIPIFIKGAGSWPKFPSTQINGLLIKNNCRRFDVYAMSGKMKEGHLGINYKLVYAQSGTIINQLVRFTIEEGLSGLEHFLGLPGTVGGAIYINARYTPKQIYINDLIENIKILNKEGEIEEVGSDYFVARSNSEFSQSDSIILSAVFRLVPEDKNTLWQRANEAAAYREEITSKK